MTEPTSPAPTPRRWPFTFTQVRLGVLMSALTFGIGGMIRNDARLIDVGIGMAVLGVGMRLYHRYVRQRAQG